MVKAAFLDEVIRKNSDVMDRVLKNAMGVVISNNDMGIPAHTSFDNTASMGIIKHMGLMIGASRSAVRDIDTENDLIYLRIATRKFEYLVGPEKDFSIVVVQ